MEIGGSDIVVKTSAEVPREVVLGVFKYFWPNLVVEDDGSCRESDYFVYENQAAKDAWDQDFSEDIDAQMIYVLPRKNEITFVIDSNKKTMPIIHAVIDKLNSH